MAEKRRAREGDGSTPLDDPMARAIEQALLNPDAWADWAMAFKFGVDELWVTRDDTPAHAQVRRRIFGALKRARDQWWTRFAVDPGRIAEEATGDDPMAKLIRHAAAGGFGTPRACDVPDVLEERAAQLVKLLKDDESGTASAAKP